MEVLRRLPHDGRRLVDQPLGDEPRVEVDVGAHRVMPHVLDAADEHDVGRTHRDLACARGGRGERARAHAIDGEARDRRRKPREERDVTTERQPLVADLRGGGEDDVVDPLGRKLRVTSEQLAHRLDRHVVRARLREQTVGGGAAERGAHSVHVDDLAKLGHGETILPGDGGLGGTRGASAASASRTALRAFPMRPTSGSDSSRAWGTRPGRRGSRC